MPTATELPAVGRTISVDAGRIVFNPANTNYELNLELSGSAPAAGSRTVGTIHVVGRKVWTVSSGGNFIAPIFGPPKIVQGRIRHLDEKQMIVQTGAPILIDLPEKNDAYDLVNGPLAVGTLVNVTILPGAKFIPSPA